MAVFDQKDRRNVWMQTFTGRQFYPFRPEDSEILIEDIAHHLSNIARFTGASSKFYSVAQHSILVSQLVPPEFALVALLHDASEAYTNDMGAPQKYGLPDFREMENAIQNCICQRFAVPWPMPDCVKRADEMAVATEARDLMPNAPTLWKLPGEPILGVKIIPWASGEAEQPFLDRFRKLTAYRP